MKTSCPYRSCVLRYEHDIGTGEFLNLGVLLWFPENRRLLFRHTEITGRLTSAFPGADGLEIVSALKELRAALRELPIPSRPDGDLMSFAHRVLPADDSSLKWSAVSAGRTEDPETALAALFERMVTRYEPHRQPKVRSDRDLWRHLEAFLRPHQVLPHFYQTVVQSPLKRYRFEHAWQNHCPHIIAPVSLDGESEDSMAGKATQWMGQVLDLMRSKQEFQLHLVLGEPGSPKFRNEYESAVALLKEGVTSSRVEIIPEAETPAFAERTAHEIKSHLETNW